MHISDTLLHIFLVIFPTKTNPSDKQMPSCTPGNPKNETTPQQPQQRKKETIFLKCNLCYLKKMIPTYELFKCILHIFYGISIFLT